MRHKEKIYAFVCPVCRHADIIVQDFISHLRTHDIACRDEEVYSYCQMLPSFRRLFPCYQRKANGDRCDFRAISRALIVEHEERDHSVTSDRPNEPTQAQTASATRPREQRQQNRMMIPKSQTQQSFVTPVMPVPTAHSTSSAAVYGSTDYRLRMQDYECTNTSPARPMEKKQRRNTDTPFADRRPPPGLPVTHRAEHEATCLLMRTADYKAVCTIMFEKYPAYGSSCVFDYNRKHLATIRVTPHGSLPKFEKVPPIYPSSNPPHKGTLMDLTTRPHTARGCVECDFAPDEGSFRLTSEDGKSSTIRVWKPLF